MSIGKLASGILIGAAAGAILGILLAPDKGSETRRKMSKKGTDFTDSIKGKFDGIVGDISKKYEEVRSEAERLMDEGREKANGFKKEWKDTIS